MRPRAASSKRGAAFAVAFAFPVSVEQAGRGDGPWDADPLLGQEGASAPLASEFGVLLEEGCVLVAREGEERL